MGPLVLLLAKCPEPRDTLEKHLESLWERASRWEVGSQVDTVRAARDTLVQYGEAALRFAYGKMKTTSPLELRALKNLFLRFGPAARDWLKKALADSSDTVRAVACYLIGEVRDTFLAEGVAERLSDPSSRVRRSAVSALGKLGIGRYAEKIAPFLEDTSPRTRAAAAGALGKLGADSLLIRALGDENLPAATAAQRGIKDPETLLPLVEKGNLRAIQALGLALRRGEASFDTVRVRRALFKLLDDHNPAIRGWAWWAIAPLKNEALRVKALLAKETEEDPFVLWALEEF